MSPTTQALLMFLASPAFGLVLNAILAKVLPAHGVVRKFSTSYLASTPGQVMAVANALQAKSSAATLQAVEAVAVGVSEAAKAAESEAGDDK